MSIVIHEALRAYIDPLTEHEYEALERSLLTEGCRDALVCWGNVLIDGHNRYAICQKHQLPYKVVQNDHFANIEEVQLWMIDNHLARRSVSDFQRGMLALRKKEILSIRNQQQNQQHSASAEPEQQESEQAIPVIKPTQSRQEIARVAGISSHAVVQIEKIQRAASPELVRAVRDGSISISAAATIASLPTEEQKAAVAGGRKELQEVARQVREKNRVQRQQAKPKPETTAAEVESPPWETTATQSTAEPGLTATTGHPAVPQQELQQRLYELETENQRLKDEIEQLRTALQRAQA